MTDEENEIPPDSVVIDSCVLIDMVVAERPRHIEAQNLSRALRRCGLTGIFPAHVFFEFMSAIMDEDSRAGRPVRIALVESTPGIRFDTILLPLDAEFITKYIIEEFKANGPIKLRAGDLPFVAVARRNNLRLITEDTGMQREARRLGVDAFTIAEFLSAVRDAQKTSASRIE